MTDQEWIQQLEEEGYKELHVVPFEPNAVVGEHTHDQATLHVILEGDMTLTDKDGEMQLYAGDRFEIPAGTVHSAKSGPNGCKFIAGVKG